jgi:hypothetical protein
VSTINIEVIDSTVQTVPKKSGKGTYEKAIVTFKDNTFGKVDSKQLMDWVEPDVFKTMAKAGKGQTYSVEREKDNNGYWVWKSVARQDGVVTPPDAAVSKMYVPASDISKAAPTRSTYETPEERAQKQIYIVRQSSLANAIAYANMQGGAGISDVLETAAKFENYVFGKGIAGLTDDEIE